jgi:hypothetical protein
MKKTFFSLFEGASRLPRKTTAPDLNEKERPSPFPKTRFKIIKF